MGIVLRAVSCGSMVGLGELEGKSRELNILVQHGTMQLVVKKGVLYRRYEDSEHLQIIHQDILKQLHEGILGGHLGEGKTLSRRRRGFIGQVMQEMLGSGVAHVRSVLLGKCPRIEAVPLSRVLVLGTCNNSTHTQLYKYSIYNTICGMAKSRREGVMGRASIVQLSNSGLPN